MNYLATCYSHFGAIRFRKLCIRAGYQAKLMPVPRSLSSSCGTCVAFAGDHPFDEDQIPEEVEQIVQEQGGGYLCLYRAVDS